MRSFKLMQFVMVSIVAALFWGPAQAGIVETLEGLDIGQVDPDAQLPKAIEEANTGNCLALEMVTTALNGDGKAASDLIASAADRYSSAAERLAGLSDIKIPLSDVHIKMALASGLFNQSKPATAGDLMQKMSELASSASKAATSIAGGDDTPDDLSTLMGASAGITELTGLLAIVLASTAA